MNRRNALSGTLIGTLLAAFSRAAGVSGTGNRFTLQVGDQVQDVIVVNNTAYTLSRRPPANESFVCAHSMGSSGRLLWQYKLPSALYLGLGLHADGSVLVHCIGYGGPPTPTHNLLKFDISSGEISIFSNLTAGPPFHHAGTGTLVRIHEDGGIEKFDAIKSQPISTTITTMGKSIGHLCVEPLDSMTIAIIDQQVGEISSLDLAVGALQKLPVISPLLADSLAYYGKIEQQYAVAKPQLQPQVITAVGPNSSGGLSLLLSPYKSDGSASVLSISSIGANLAVWRITLPDRKSVGNPFKLGWVSNQLAVLFSGGTYTLYPV